jgi:hypothetical protein
MSLKIVLAGLLAAFATLAEAQNDTPADSISDSYHIFFPSMGKDILAARVGGHRYKIVNVYNQPEEVYIDDRKIAAGDRSKYDAVLEKIRASVRDDDEERDIRQMERSRRQAEREKEQARREQREAQRQREQAQREGRQVEPTSYEIDDSDDDQDITRERQQSADDRAMLKKGIRYLIDEHLIANRESLRTMVLTDSSVSINGVSQPHNVFQQLRSLLGDWARNGLSYGSNGPADNYSLSIND